MSLSFKEVAEIMKIIDSSSCEELVLEAEGMRLVVRRGAGSGAGEATTVATPAPNVSTPASPAPASSPPPHAGSQSSPAPASKAVEGTITENAPMVGTFYRRPSPDEAPFVETGAKVAAGDPLCMIEVMKLYTTISASVDGVVEAILVDDAALVEFDQPLFVIRPA